MLFKALLFAFAARGDDELDAPARAPVEDATMMNWGGRAPVEDATMMNWGGRAPVEDATMMNWGGPHRGTDLYEELLRKVHEGRSVGEKKDAIMALEKRRYYGGYATGDSRELKDHRSERMKIPVVMVDEVKWPEISKDRSVDEPKDARSETPLERLMKTYRGRSVEEKKDARYGGYGYGGYGNGYALGYGGYGGTGYGGTGYGLGYGDLSGTGYGGTGYGLGYGHGRRLEDQN